MTYGVQIRVGSWQWLCPVGGKPYEFATVREADDAAAMCYGGMGRKAWRVRRRS